MTPAARVQTAIEILDRIITAARDQGASADVILADGFRARRYAGSKDRRAIRDLVYRAIRLAGERPDNGRAAMLGVAASDPAVAALFDGQAYGPPPIGVEEKPARAGYAPKWLLKRLHASGLDNRAVAAMADRAPLDLRVNRLKAERQAVLAELPDFVATPLAPDGLRGEGGAPIDRHPLHLDGSIEVQDEGSQLIALAAAVQPGMTVVDLCAGAGGKTLALAAMMGNRGRLIACDTDRARLSRLPPRAERAGVTICETRLLNPGREAEALGDLIDAADVVLIDAPCSGTGTWRRNPEARWRLSPERIDRLTALQSRLMSIAEPLVKPGGRMIYAVCSLLDEEGPDRIQDFLEGNPGWASSPLLPDIGERRGAGVRLSPITTATDGFFIAGLYKP